MQIEFVKKGKTRRIKDIGLFCMFGYGYFSFGLFLYFIDIIYEWSAHDWFVEEKEGSFVRNKKYEPVTPHTIVFPNR